MTTSPSDLLPGAIEVEAVGHDCLGARGGGLGEHVRDHVVRVGGHESGDDREGYPPSLVITNGKSYGYLKEAAFSLFGFWVWVFGNVMILLLLLYDD